jgi:hypothetical protein
VQDESQPLCGGEGFQYDQERQADRISQNRLFCRIGTSSVPAEDGVGYVHA